jgi:hypothetical protein
MTYDQVAGRYEYLSRPSVLLKTEREVIDFLSLGEEDDVEAFIVACLQDEAYEWAAVASKYKRDVFK